MRPLDEFDGDDGEPEVDDDRYEPPATLDGPGIRFHGHRRHPVPKHVWQAIRDAAQRVLDNYTRVGTPCGHVPWRAGENHCAVMICPYVLPPGAYEVTRDELAVVTLRTTPPVTLPRPTELSPAQRHLMLTHPELNIACPRCKSPRGFMCVSGGRTSSRIHTARKKTWHSTANTVIID